MEARHAFFPPELAERFAPETLLASGGFGSVWRARQKELDRPVAIKILHAEHADTEEQVQRFTGEARLCATLKHPGIVRVLDHGVAGGVPWMAFELVEGRSLRAWVERGPTEWRAVAEVGRQVALALEAARREGVVHRDIKPDNLLEAGAALYKIADFGIAKWAGASVKTADGMILGTPAYISPVQIRGHLPEHQSDLYALGVTLFELCAGRTPFVDDNPVRMLERHLTQSPPPLRSLVPAVPVEMERIVTRLLSKDRLDRFETAEEVDLALAAALAGGAPAAMTRRVLRVTAPPVERVKTAPDAAIGWVLVAVAGVGIGTIGAMALGSHRPPPVAASATPSRLSVAPPTPEPVEDVAVLVPLMHRMRDQIMLSASKAPEAVETLDPAARGRVTRSLAELSAAAIEFWSLLRRVNHCAGEHVEQLLEMERIGDLLAGQATDLIQMAAFLGGTEGSPTGSPAGLVRALRRIRDELDRPSASRALSPIQASLKPMFTELLRRGNVLTGQKRVAAIWTGALEARRVAPEPGLHALVSEAFMLSRVCAKLRKKRPLALDRALDEKLSGVTFHEACARLVELVAPLQRVAPADPGTVPDLWYVQTGAACFAAASAFDDAQSKPVRRAALEALRLLARTINPYILKSAVPGPDFPRALRAITVLERALGVPHDAALQAHLDRHLPPLPAPGAPPRR